MTVSTTPPATILSKKFFRDGEIPGCAASAISGITSAAVRAAAVNPVIAFSLIDDDAVMISTWLLDLTLLLMDLVFSFNGLKNSPEPANRVTLWLTGIAMVFATVTIAMLVFTSVCLQNARDVE